VKPGNKGEQMKAAPIKKNVVLPEDIHTRLRILAARHKMTMMEYVAMLINNKYVAEGLDKGV